MHTEPSLGYTPTIARSHVNKSPTYASDCMNKPCFNSSSLYAAESVPTHDSICRFWLKMSIEKKKKKKKKKKNHR